MRTNGFDFLGVLAVDLFHASPSIKPVQRLVCLPVFGHGGGPMDQVYNKSESDYSRVEVITHRDRRNRCLATPEICSVLRGRRHGLDY
jgi:hypothetical protein